MFSKIMSPKNLLAQVRCLCYHKQNKKIYFIISYDVAVFEIGKYFATMYMKKVLYPYIFYQYNFSYENNIVCDLIKEGSSFMRTVIGIDLFAGAGGLSLGAERNGIDVLYAVEKDIYASKTYDYRLLGKQAASMG